MSVWSEKLNMSLPERNVTVLPLGGGEYAERKAPMRSDVLAGISQKAPIPHLFLLDRDERGQAEICKLQEALGKRVHILEKRELENYLLVPRALLATIRSKYLNDAQIVERIDQTSEVQIGQLIQTTAESLYGLVLLKRIRAELPGLVGGLLPRETAKALANHARDADLQEILRQRVETRVSQHLDTIDFHTIVHDQRAALDSEWSDQQRQLCLAPGEEIVAAVFQYFEAEYKKPDDTVRIAKEVCADEIAPEIKQVLTRIWEQAGSF